jgi:predicted TIM-barrel fold metal-dependent hydrolase
MPRPGKEGISVRAFWDLDQRLADLDRDGIDRQVLIFHTAHVFYSAERKIAIDAARRYNDGLAEMIAACKAPHRYMGAAPLPMQDPAAAADEAERAVRELHMPVVVIGTNVNGNNLDLPEFEPFFARINELNVPLIIHSDGLTSYQTHPAAGERTGWSDRAAFVFGTPPQRPHYPVVWWMLTHPFEHMIAIARIIYSGMLDRFPNLKFILEEGHVGYALYLFDRLEEGWEFGEMLQGRQAHLNGPKKHPLDYLEHFHWAVESEDSLIGEVIRRWGRGANSVQLGLSAQRYTLAGECCWNERGAEGVFRGRSGQGHVAKRDPVVALVTSAIRLRRRIKLKLEKREGDDDVSETRDLQPTVARVTNISLGGTRMVDDTSSPIAIYEISHCHYERFGQSGTFRITTRSSLPASAPPCLGRLLFGLSIYSDPRSQPCYSPCRRSSLSRLFRVTSAGVRPCDSSHRSKSRTRTLCSSRGMKGMRGRRINGAVDS